MRGICSLMRGIFDTNTGNIFTNAGNTFTNTGNIFTNTGNIFTHTGNIFTNTGNLGTTNKCVYVNCVFIILFVIPMCACMYSSMHRFMYVCMCFYVFKYARSHACLGPVSL